MEDVVGPRVEHGATQLIAILRRGDDHACVLEEDLSPVPQCMPVMRLERVGIRAQRVDGDNVVSFRRKRRTRMRADEPGAARDEDGAHPRASVHASTASAQWSTECSSSIRLRSARRRSCGRSAAAAIASARPRSSDEHRRRRDDRNTGRERFEDDLVRRFATGRVHEHVGRSEKRRHLLTGHGVEQMRAPFEPELVDEIYEPCADQGVSRQRFLAVHDELRRGAFVE